MSERTMMELARSLQKSFARWDHLAEHGGSDPFWPDGMGLNLTRNHILYDKNQMEQLVAAEQEEVTLFPSELPDVYYRETPPEMPKDYMAKADEIRARAAEQLTLYERDPNFIWLRDHHDEVFPKGETKGTKTAGLNPIISGSLAWFRRHTEQDDLVAMRRIFWESYEAKAERWAIEAEKMKAYLAKEHCLEDDEVLHDDNDLEDPCCEAEEDISAEEKPERKPSLADQIKSAQTRAGHANKNAKQQEEQMSLF